jgi:hypothetical protein
VVTIVGKRCGPDLVPLEEKYYEQISGEPLVDDVFMRHGKVFARTKQGDRDVTHEFCELAGWEMYEPPLQWSDVL